MSAGNNFEAEEIVASVSIIRFLRDEEEIDGLRWEDISYWDYWLGCNIQLHQIQIFQ